MKAPRFWFATASAGALLLRPLARLYGAIAARRMDRPGVRVEVPVITIGNFVAGGAGKTPTAIAVARLLLARGEAPAFLSRGYGGSRSSGAPLAVEGQGAAEVGDEPLLLARVAPSFIGADRAAAAALAMASAKPTVLILDDGLQSRRVEPDVAIVIVDGETGVGNGLCLPAGPLRAPLVAQLRCVHAIIVVGEGVAGEKLAHAAREQGVQVFRATTAADDASRAIEGRDVVAFAGIARPEKFVATLEKIGARVVARRFFADHHRYGQRDIDDLRSLAQLKHAALVTTEKDAVKLPRGLATAVGISMNLGPAFESFLLAQIEAARGRMLSR